MNHAVRNTINELTASIRDLSAKPLLRSVLEAELLKLKFTEEEIKPELDRVFKVTLQ